MKKYFLSYVMTDFLFFLAFSVVIASPLAVLLMIKSKEFSILATGWVAMAYYYVINSYINFKPEEWKRKQELEAKFNSLSLNQKEELLTKNGKAN